MLIDRNALRFIVLNDEPVLTALNKISSNKSGFVLVVNENGQLEGMLTDGDFRRWLTSTPEINLEAPVSNVANTRCQTAKIDAPPETISALFSDRIRMVPLLDDYGRVMAIAFPARAEMSIAGRLIGKGQPAYVISEIGNNHQGDVELAKRLVDLSAEAGADCVKFQMRDLESLYGGGKSSDANQDLGAQYTLDLLARFSLKNDDMFRVFDHARERGIEPLCTPWDIPSLEALEKYGIAGYKVASADLTNHDLLTALADTTKPLLCSTGMSQEWEIRDSVALLKSRGAPFVLLHVNSTYPTPYKDVQLRYMDRLAEIAGGPVGYSGHERGWTVPVAAVARGACVVEKHFTIDRSFEGNDHKVSLLPEEFAEMMEAIRSVEEAMGVSGERTITQGEMMNREVLAKSLKAAHDIEPGTVITEDMIVVQSPGQGLQPNQRSALIGRTVRRTVPAGTPFFPSDLQDEIAQARPFRFPRPWGIPVRWHDYRAMLEKTNLTMLEYHLSYKDIEVKLEDWFDEPLDIDYVVHAPELFKGDHILDLASPDEAYRAHSIAELQRVIDVTRALKKWHKRATTPQIIVNMGGFSTSRPMPVSARAGLYARMEECLAKLDREGVELIPQTMPPFPWHFGGQSYHNLFMDPDEIVAFCKKNGMRICFDVSHSQLACNHFGLSMNEFCRKVGPYTAHLHIVDAKGIDGEGLQIGEGTMDFMALGQALDAYCPDASFVPEIWQGHKDGGAGFWFALDKLEASMGAKVLDRPPVSAPLRVANS